MMKPFTAIMFAVLAVLAASAVRAAEPKPNDSASHVFALSPAGFLLDGKPFQIRSGEMHPERIPREYWRHRIQMARAMGLNTIAIYVFWNNHELGEGKFDFKTWNRDTGEFLKIAEEEGMWVLLRPGPYCCGEWDFGGVPTYLLRYPEVKIRCMDPRYIAAASRYLNVLADVVRPYQVNKGGPIVMLQVENEYGSYGPGHDRKYIDWLAAFWRGAGIQVPFYTADGAGEAALSTGMVDGGALGMDPAGNEDRFAMARRVGKNKVPVFCSEIYQGWLVHWGEGFSNQNALGGSLNFFMNNRYSFNLYMVHGGTNWGFTAGANGDGGSYQADITSYDYAAPIDEQGRATPSYMAIRNQMASFLPPGETLPPIPAPIPAMRIDEIQMERWTSLWENLPAPITTASPRTFEDIGQNQGLVLYRHKAALGGGGDLNLQDLHDYALVFAQGQYIGKLDRRNGEHALHLPNPVADSQIAALDILVEGMGHINYGGSMTDDRKGITRGVTLEKQPIGEWEMYPFPLTDQWITSLPRSHAEDHHPGGIFKGSFHLDTVADTFMDMSDYQKGFVWINGHNLGRFWRIGPQQRLYCPACWLNQGENEIIVLDLHETEALPVWGMLSQDDKRPLPWAGKALKLDGLRPVLAGALQNNAKPQEFRFPSTAARFVCLEGVTTFTPPIDWMSAAEISLLDKDGNPVPRSHWKIAWVSSENLNGENDAASNAIDGDPSTFWHTEWNGHSTPGPHQIVIDMGQAVEISGMIFTQRADQHPDGTANGRIKDFRLFAVQRADQMEN